MPQGALLFDLDGTLVDSAAGIAIALNRLRAERGGEPLPVTAVRPLVALGAETLVARALGPMATAPSTDLAAFRAYLAVVPADRGSIYPGVYEALTALADGGWRMAIVTNKPEALSRKLLDHLDLLHFFDALVGGDTTERPKPAPDPVQHALAKLNAAPRESLFIGDSDIDLGAARALGIDFLLFEGGYGAADCPRGELAAAFARFSDLPGLVEATIRSRRAQSNI